MATETDFSPTPIPVSVQIATWFSVKCVQRFFLPETNH